MRSLVAFLLALIIGIFGLWVWVSLFVGREDYISLARGAFLLLGIIGIFWGIMVHRPANVGFGIGLILVGLASFFVMDAGNWDFHAGPFWHHVGRGLTRPLAPHVDLLRLLAAGLLVGNAVMLHRRLGVYHIITGNLVLVAVAVAMAMFMG